MATLLLAASPGLEVDLDYNANNLKVNAFRVTNNVLHKGEAVSVEAVITLLDGRTLGRVYAPGGPYAESIPINTITMVQGGGGLEPSGYAGYVIKVPA